MLSNLPAHEERAIAAEVSHKAMVAGWEKAIQDVAKKHGMKILSVENILNRVSADQKHREPSNRIDELADWETQKNGKSDLKRGENNLSRLSPGLRKYMEAKLSSGKSSQPSGSGGESQSSPEATE